MTIENVSLQEIYAAARARHASLVPETCGYLILSITHRLGGTPLSLNPRHVLLSTEGTISIAGPRRGIAMSVSASLIRELFASLLEVSQGSMPALTAASTARTKDDLEKVFGSVAKALIPINRGAAKRALARLARETIKAKSRNLLEDVQIPLPSQRSTASDDSRHALGDGSEDSRHDLGDGCVTEQVAEDPSRGERPAPSVPGGDGGTRHVDDARIADRGRAVQGAAPPFERCGSSPGVMPAEAADPFETSPEILVEITETTVDAVDLYDEEHTPTVAENLAMDHLASLDESARQLPAVVPQGGDLRSGDAGSTSSDVAYGIRESSESAESASKSRRAESSESASSRRAQPNIPTETESRMPQDLRIEDDGGQREGAHEEDLRLLEAIKDVQAKKQHDAPVSDRHGAADSDDDMERLLDDLGQCEGDSISQVASSLQSLISADEDTPPPPEMFTKLSIQHRAGSSEQQFTDEQLGESPAPPVAADDRRVVDSDLSPTPVSATPSSRSFPPHTVDRSKRRTSRVPMLMGAAILTLGIGSFAFVQQHNPELLSLSWLVPSDGSSASTEAATPLGIGCSAPLTLKDLPSPHEVLLRLGEIPLETPPLPSGVRLELIVTSPDHRSQRIIVPNDAPWQLGDGRRWLDLTVDLERFDSSPDGWPAAPAGQVGGVGPAGVISITGTDIPVGTEVWLVSAAGTGQTARVSVSCEDTASLLVVNPDNPSQQRRLTVPPQLLRAAAQTGIGELAADVR